MLPKHSVKRKCYVSNFIFIFLDTQEHIYIMFSLTYIHTHLPNPHTLRLISCDWVLACVIGASETLLLGFTTKCHAKLSISCY